MCGRNRHLPDVQDVVPALVARARHLVWGAVHVRKRVPCVCVCLRKRRCVCVSEAFGIVRVSTLKYAGCERDLWSICACVLVGKTEARFKSEGAVCSELASLHAPYRKDHSTPVCASEQATRAKEGDAGPSGKNATDIHDRAIFAYNSHTKSKTTTYKLTPALPRM